jgi:hypothetical protein
MTLNELKKHLLKRSDLPAEHDALAEEFSIAEALIRGRRPGHAKARRPALTARNGTHSKRRSAGALPDS